MTTMYFLNVVVTVILIMQFDRTQACEPMDNKPCACVYGNEYVDLEGINNIPLIANKSSSEGHAYLFVMNPCYLLEESTRKTDANCKESSVCQQDTTLSSGVSSWYPAGSTTIEYTGTPDLDLKFTYTAQLSTLDKKHRSSTVRIVCVPGQTVASLEYDTEEIHADVIEYEFILSGQECCAKELPSSNSSLSAGSILLIIFFVLVGVYIIGGVLFNKFVRGYTGLEIIPNHEFWGDLPKLVMDGWRFTLSCGCCVSQTADAPGYDNI